MRQAIPAAARGIAMALSLLAGCSDSPGGADDGDGAGVGVTGSGGSSRHTESLTHDGLARSWTLVLPGDGQPNPAGASSALLPLIIAMHGGGGNAAQFERSTGLTDAALAAGYAIVYPNGVGSGLLKLPVWNAGNCCGASADEGIDGAGIDDVGFIRAMLDDIAARHPIDPQRVHATGHSNGGMMAYRLACDLADRIASIAPNAAADVTTSCQPVRAVPVLHLHSQLDENVPVDGGIGVGIAGVAFPGLAESIAGWVAHNGCDASTPAIESGTVGYTHTTWSGCVHGVTVELYLTEDGGHAWPGGEPGSITGDPPSAIIDANALLPAFFSLSALP